MANYPLNKENRAVVQRAYWNIWTAQACSTNKNLNHDPLQVLWKKLKLMDRNFSVKILVVKENFLKTLVLNTLQSYVVILLQVKSLLIGQLRDTLLLTWFYRECKIITVEKETKMFRKLVCRTNLIPIKVHWKMIN